MFDAVRNNKKIVQGFLLLITLPFAFWGVDSYVKGGSGGDEVASIGGSPIFQAEFQEALREQQDRLRNMMGENFNPAMLDTPETRQAVLENLVNQRLLALESGRLRLTVSDTQLRDTIAGIAAFQDNGQFSKQRYEAVLQSQGMTQPVFEGRLRRDLALQQLVGAVAEGNVVSRAALERVFAVQFEQRQVSQVALDARTLAASVKLADGAVRKYYDDNRSRFELPAQLKAEYVLFTQEAVASQLVVSEGDLRKEYDAHPERYRQEEERRASHILIQAPKDGDEASRKTAREKAVALLAQLKAKPTDFARLARESSQDPGSAEKGGDLGFFPRGAMVKPFEDAAFALAHPGDISGLVESDFGYHIIRLEAVKAAKVRAFEDVKAEIKEELKRTESGRKFAELVEGFSNTVYEQADSLKPAAEKYKLEVLSSDWLAKGQKAASPFDNDKVLTALFADDAVKNKRNTDAIDLGQGRVIAARVLEHKPASVRPFEEVKADIERLLTTEEAVKLAEKDGSDKLAKLLKGESVELAWTTPQTVSRADQGVPPDVLAAVFRARADKLPSYAGLTVPGRGYALFRIEKVMRPEITSKDDPRLKALGEQYARLQAEQDFAAYIASLRKRHEVKLSLPAISEQKDR